MLNRGSAADYDSWESLGNAGWGWEGLYPYFVKVSLVACHSGSVQARLRSGKS